jgi:hypothetical protein
MRPSWLDAAIRGVGSMIGPKHAKNLWVLALAVALISAVVILWGRWQVEKANNTVELVMDYRAAELLCQSVDYPLEVFLRQARDAGLTSVAVGELTISDIATLGQVYLLSGRQILDYDKLSPVTNPVKRKKKKNR